VRDPLGLDAGAKCDAWHALNDVAPAEPVLSALEVTPLGHQTVRRGFINCAVCTCGDVLNIANTMSTNMHPYYMCAAPCACQRLYLYTGSPLRATRQPKVTKELSLAAHVTFPNMTGARASGAAARSAGDGAVSIVPLSNRTGLPPLVSNGAGGGGSNGGDAFATKGGLTSGAMGGGATGDGVTGATSAMAEARHQLFCQLRAHHYVCAGLAPPPGLLRECVSLPASSNPARFNACSF